MVEWDPIRWGDSDRYFGPFTFSISETYRPIYVGILSGRSDDDDGLQPSLRVSAFGYTLIMRTPSIIKESRKKVYIKNHPDPESGWYWEVFEREYGFNYFENHLTINFGLQTHSSDTTQDWGIFLPWGEWRRIRSDLYDENGMLWAETEELSYPESSAVRNKCPKRSFVFKDYDGEEIVATTFIRELEFRRGIGWFKWLSLFCKSMIHRWLNVTFSKETGVKKGSWKGGIIEHSIQMSDNKELHESAFRRYCEENNMTFLHELSNPTN